MELVPLGRALRNYRNKVLHRFKRIELTPADSALRYYRDLGPDAADPLLWIAREIKPGERVLDIGCGPGVLAEVTRRDKFCAFDGVDRDRAALDRARTFYDELAEADLEKDDLAAIAPRRDYDTIVLADVLEHLVWPGRLLRQVPSLLKSGGRVLISLPNIGYFGLVSELIAGRFAYRSCGLLDHSHLRHFTRASVGSFLAANGFSARRIDAIRKPIAATEFDPQLFEALPETVRAALSSAVDADVFQFLIEAVADHTELVASTDALI